MFSKFFKKKNEECFKGVSRVFNRTSKDALRRFQRHFKIVECFEVVSRIFQRKCRSTD